MTSSGFSEIAARRPVASSVRLASADNDFVGQSDLNAHAFADRRQQLDFVVIGQRIRLQRGAQSRARWTEC